MQDSEHDDSFNTSVKSFHGDDQQNDVDELDDVLDAGPGDELGNLEQTLDDIPSTLEDDKMQLDSIKKSRELLDPIIARTVACMKAVWPENAFTQWEKAFEDVSDKFAEAN